MSTSIFSEIKKVQKVRYGKLYLALLLSMFFINSTLAQPVWVPTTPSIGTVGSLRIPINYGIDRVGTIYIVILNYDNPVNYAPGIIKSEATNAPYAQKVFQAAIPVTAGNINTILQVIANVVNVNRTHTVYIVAEGTVGGLQAVTTRISVTTLPCPKIDVLTGFTQPVTCINKLPIATFQTVILNPDVDGNGVLKGTQWTLDWGDGNTAAYTSTVDNDLPPIALRTHTYSTITDCNYVFSNTIRNPCGETRAVQYVAVVHGRDIPSDGDGVLQIVDNSNGSTTINVCAGTQTTVTLRDNSTWNCQNPVLPGGLTAVPNTDPRNIEWLYGRDPVGAITNTITGAVAIAALGNAPQASGRLSPIAAPGTLSQAITIPATCLAGQYFRVYLKNWNKCNWTDPEYVNTFVDINVIAAPPAPTAASRTICTGDVRTLTVTSPAVGTITWYSNALLTTVVGTGLTYVPVQTTPGSYDFWVTDQSTTGLLCMSPSTKVTLTIREALSQPGVITGPAQICSNQAGIIFSVVANPPTMPVGGTTQYTWTVPGGWTITAGQGTRQITVTADANAGAKTISVVNQYTTAPTCPSASRTFNTNLNPVATINSAATKTVCDNTPLAYTATSATAGCSFAWTRAVVAGISNAAGAGATSSINESLDNTSTAAVNVTYVIIPTINGCAGTPFNLVVTVNPTAVITSATTKTVCNSTALAYTTTSSTAGATFAWTRAVVAGISNGAGAGAAALINESLTNTTTGPVNATYIITPSYGGCAGTPINLVVTVNPTAVITSSSTANVCENTPIGYTATSSTAGATFAWTRAVVAGISNAAGAGATSSINESLDNTTVSPITVTYLITPSYGGCAGTTFPFWVTVNPTSVITSANSKTVCDNTPLAYTATSSTPLATFSWTRAVVAGISNGAGAGATASINESLDNTTTAPVSVVYVITPAINLCPGTPFNLTVTVNPTPVITSAATKTVCDITPLAYTATSSTAGATFAWTRAVVAGISNVAGSGATNFINESLDNTTSAPVNATYIITPSYGGCAGTPFNLVVTVNPTPTINSAAAKTVCDNTPIGYTATSATAGATFAWTRAVVAGITNGAGAGATSSINESLDNNTIAPVNATYIITPSIGGCPGTPFNFVVTVNPTAVITSAAAKTVCSNTSVAYTATSSTAGATFAWTRAVVAGISNGAGAGATANINESLINTTAADVNAIYVITPSIGGCAGTPFNLTVTVHPQFTLAQFHDDASICNNTATNINVVATGGTSPYTVNYTKNGVAQAAWNNYVSGTNMTTGALLANTTYALTSVTDNFGCPAQSLGTTILITVGSAPTAATLTGSGNGCFGSTSTIKSVISGGAPTYTINYTRNGVVQAPITLYNSGANFSLGVLPVGTWNYQITSVTDFCGNTVPVGGLPGAYSITINPVPDITGTVPAAQTLCNDGTANITLNTTVNNTIFNYTVASVPAAGYSWTAGKNPIAGSITDADGNGTETLTRQLQHNYTDPVVVTYTITPTGPGATACIGTSITRTVTVNPTAVITSAATKTICDNAATAYTATSSTAGATFAWTRAVVAGIANPIGSGATSSINENLDNTTTAPVVVRYVITPSYGACAGTPFNFDVTVNPTAVITSAATATVCNNTPLGYTATSSTAGATFAWTRAVVAGISNLIGSGATSSINESLINTTTAAVVVRYIITPSYGACAGTPFNLDVTVNPTAVITSAATATVCNNTPLGYTATSSTAGATFAWTRAVVAGISNLIGSGATSSINESLINTTTAAVVVRYVITPSYGACAGTPFNLDVTVNPTAVITSAATKTICDNAATAYTATSSTAGATFAWTRAVVAGIANPIGSGATSSINENLDNTTTAPVVVRYVITPSYGACAGTPFNFDVTVNPTAVITSAATATVCNNTPLGYTATSSTAGATFAWTRAVVAGISNLIGSGATSSINESLINTTTAAVVVRYVITPSYGACAGTPFNLDVTVNPTAVITSAATKTICDNAATAYTATSSTAGATFAWTRAVVAGIANPIGSGATSSINENLDNTTTAPVVVRYVITPSYGACAGTPFNFDVTVNPTAVITSAATATVCNNTPLGYTATSSTAGATFAWTRAVVAGISNLIGSGATSSINESLINTTTAAVVVRYIITPSYGACAGTPFNLDVTVNPTAVITSAATATVCNNTPLGYTATSSTAGATFAWTRAVVAGISNLIGSGATSSINESLINTTTAAVVVRYVITPGYGACAGTPFNLDVTVNPTAVITSAATKTICDNAATAYTATSSTAGATFAWTRAVVAGIANPIGSGATSSINENLDNTTTAPVVVRYVITPSYGACAGTPFNFDVTVNPTAVITSAATATVCNNTPLGYTATSSTAGATFAWTRAVVAGISNLIGSGATSSINESLINTTTVAVVVRYVITPSYGACAGTPFNLDVTVNPTAVITSAATKTICDNAATAYTATSSTAGATFAWTRAVVAGIANPIGSGATSSINENLDNTTTAPVVVRYVITPSYGACAGTPFNFDVTVNPTAVITSAATATVCNNTPLGYTATSSTAGATFTWTRAVVAGISNPIGSGATSSINESLDNTTTAPVVVRYVITPSYGACAGTPFNLDVTVNPIGQVDQPSSQVLCNGVNITPITFTTVNTGGITSYTWTNSVPGIGLAASGTGNIGAFAATNVSTVPVVATIVVIPTFTNNAVGCTGPSKTFTITVNPTPLLNSSLTPADVCSNNLFSYAPTSATAGTTFNWSRAVIAGITPAGPTSGANNPNETLRNITSLPIAVTYQYTLAANGCSNIQNVVVNIKPEVVITPAQNPSSCSGNALNYRILMNNFTNPADNVTFTWGIPVLNPVNPGFTGGSARAVPSAANITDIYTNTMGVPGTATYTVTPFKNGCTGTPVTVVVTVNSEPVLDPGLNAFACSNSPIGLILKEAAGSVVPSYYNIISKTVAIGLTDVGNAVIPNGTAPAAYLSTDKYTNTTGVNKTVTYRVQPILAPSCIGAPVDVVITIRPQPVVFPGQSKTVCSRVAIGKEILLTPPNVPAGSLFNWPAPVISDGSTQGTAGVNVVADPAGTTHINDQIHNYSSAPITATYTVTPVSQFGCAGTPVPVIITINPEPVPQPISGRDKICVTDKNIVYNVSAVGGSTFHWTVAPAVGTKTFDFNTNAILIDAAAVAGAGNITVYETNSYTCSGDLSTLPVQVYAQPAAENIIGNAIVCANSTNVYNVTNRVGSTYSWTVPGGAAIIGDPSASSITVMFANVGGTISVRETNAAGCVTNHTPKAITVNPLPTATISGGATICDGGSRNLTVDFTGVGPYTFTYAINGVPQPPIATASDPYTLNVTAAGTYTIVNVTDANCTNNGTGTTTVSFFPKPTGTISGTAEMCSGGFTTLTMTFTGVAPYTFTYTDGITPVTVVGHLTNVYTVAVSPLVNRTYTLTSLTDGNLCTGVVSGSAVISVNPPPVLTLTGINLTCYNVSTGTVNMTVAGGTAPFGYSWNGPSGFTANTQNISALAAGYYAVVVNDSKGCHGTANITLTEPPVLNGSASGTNVTCFGANDGTITISGATGGAGTYEFTINGGGLWSASTNFTTLSPGSYNVMMRDAVNPACIKVLNNALLITQPAVLNAAFVKTDVNCFGANNGSIVISAPTGGYGAYGYSVNGGATWQGSGNFTNLAPGSYSVRIRDAANTGCFVILNPAVVITEPVVLSGTVNSTNVSCFGLTDGTITVSAPAGGHGTYEYSINGGGSWQPAGNYTAVAPGTYNVQIRDAAYTGCYRVLNAAVVISQPAVLQANVASSNVTCNGANDGIINITAPLGGYGTYQYSINGGTSWQASGLYNGLLPGTYDVRIRDAAHIACELILNPGLQITEPTVLSALVIDTDITCFGANDGQIQVTNSAGGYGSYEYSDNGGSTWQATGLFTLLIPGTYDVRMRDVAHPACVKILDPAVIISQPAVLSATVNHTNVTCNGANDGTITLTAPTGGYGSYGYSINGGTSWQGSASFTNLAPGTYNIRIRDAVNTGCVIALNPAVVITQPVILSASVVKTNVTCNGVADGTITINESAGGSGSYEYTVNGGALWQASNSFTGLIPGFYNVKIRDAVNPACIITLSGSLNVTEPAALNANVAKTNVTCNGANNGTITITGPTGGYGTYEYSVTGGTTWQASGSFTNLIPGSYDIRIRDAAHATCVVILNPALLITEPVVLAATVTGTNVTCNGANDGTITINGASGGSGTYEYTVTGGAIWSGLNNFTNRAPGNFDVRIRDAAQPACVIILNAALPITQPAVLAATVTRTNITCFGASNGTITISAPSGGYGTYEYTINGGGSWQGTGNFVALGPGNYNVQIRDAAHPSCVKVLNNAVQITQPAVLNAVITTTNVSCNGANNGVINISAPSGGYGTFEFSIDGGTNWQGSGLFGALVPATYNVQIRDAANPACVITLNAALLITEPNVLTATVTSANVTCSGAGDGSINVSNSQGGYGTYEYSVNGGTSWQASGNFINLVPGSYNVQIRDKAHVTCVAVLNPALVITQPAVLSATVNSTPVSCNGSNNGTITITNPLGGYGTYGYSINGGASWQASGNFTNLSPGSYNVRIRDAANTLCVITLNPALSITEPVVLSATIASTNVTCSGAGDGTITITNPLGGYGTYEYTINGGTTWQISGNFIGIIPGFYNVQIRDAAHTSCVVILNGSLQITQPAPIAANVAKTNVTCFGANNGTITISSPAGGYGTYEYSNNGGSSWQASGNFTALVPASYNIQIRDAAHITCVTILNPALLITEPSILSASVSSTDVSCFGSMDGSISITNPLGGYGTYQYSVNGGTTWQGGGTFTNLAPASYDVRIRDAANIGCIITLNPALLISQPPVLSATITKTNVTCFGGSDGTITISAPAGGYGTYEYSINGGGAWQGSGNFIALVPGNYNVQIRDAAHTGCVKVLNASLPITQPAALTAVVTPTNVTCNGANDGVINVTTPTGGTGSYEYSTDGGTTWHASGLFSGLIPATYNVQMRDAANITCFIVLNSSVTITEPPILNAVVTSTNISCNSSNDGTISITSPTGGYGTFEYSDNGGGTWQASGNFINLAPGSYNIQIRDKAHTSCVIILNPALLITQPAVLTATVTSTNVTCFGANNGTITITNPLGGYGSYSYSINGGSTWQPTGTFTNLAPSTYIVKIRDAAHIACEATLDAGLVITQPAVLAATVTRTNITCNGSSDGTISISAPTGGYGTYQYTIDGGANWHVSGNFSGLLPGFYNVQIRDAVNTSCVVILNGSLQLTQPAALSAFVSKSNVTCNGSSDGTITILGATGGYGTFQYSINGGALWQASGSFSGLPPASYNVQMRDAGNTGCVKILDPALIISQPAVLSAIVTPSMVTCFGANDGIIIISAPVGGYGSYQFSINGGTSWQGSGTFTNLAPASYNVQIRDAGNISCVIILNPALLITQPVILSATLTHTNVTCFGGNDGTITVSAPAGGSGTYEYSINGGGSWQATGNFSLLSPGSYSVLIRDAGHTGCVVVLSNSYLISQPALLAATVAKTDISCKGSNDGTITISAPSGGNGTYEYTIDGGSSWVSSGNFTNLLPATYDIRIRDAANTSCSVILYPNMVISEPIQLAVTSTGDMLLHCFGDTDGTGTFYGSGGTMPYTFHVISNSTGATLAAPGFNSQTFFNAGAGAITIAITDFKGCFAQATINVTQPALMTPGTIAANQVLCAGDNPAQITETVPATGGPGAYNYQWQYGSTAVGPFINIAGATGNQYTPPAGANNTLYYRRMITSGLCMPVYSNIVEILVNPKPVAILTGGETICPTQTSILKVNMMVGTGPFELDIDNLGTITGYVSGSDIVVTPVSTTTYKLLRVKDANGCQVISPSANLLGSATITVRSVPLITSSPVNKTICEFGLVTFNVGASGSDLTYQWYVNTGSGFAPVADGGVYFGATNSTLSLFGATRLMNGYIYHAEVTGCSSTVTSADATLTVNTSPEITVQPKDTTACMNAGAAFSISATGTGLSYQWQVNKGTGFNNVINDAYFSGANLNTLTITNAQASFNNYIFRVLITGSCGIPVYSNLSVLRVNVPPTVTLNPGNKATCDGTGPIVFVANGSGIIDSMRWQTFNGVVWSDVHDNTNFSGSISQQLTISSVPFALNGNQFRLALKAKCITVYTTAATLTVNANPVVDFSALDPIHACGSVPMVINGNPTGGSGTWSSHLWTGDVGPLNNYFIQSPTFISQIAGTYALNYKVKDNKGCYGNGDVTVIVDAPDANFSADKSNGCTPTTVSFTKDMTGIAKFWWDFGDGSPKDSVNSNPVHTFNNASPTSIMYYNVRLTVRSPGGCLNSVVSSITVYPAIDATFTATPGIVCSGNQINFTTVPGASKYWWDFGDGASGYFSNTVTHLFTNFTTAPVVHTVSLTTTSFYNCTDVKTFDITVMPMPLPQFTANPVSQVYNAAGNPVTFTNTTNPGTWTYLWKFGDGTTSTDQSPTHTYTALGSFDVELTASNSTCSDKVKHTVNITPMPPVANFDLIPSGCSPLEIKVNNTSLNTNTPGTTYMWDFGDGGASTTKNPTYVYFNPGTFRVELTVTGPGGTSTYSQVVNSYPSPKANFEVSPTLVFVNDEKVRCFNLTQGADSYLWEFGDGDTSKLSDPYHKYMEEGTYDITLWAYLHNEINGEVITCSDKYVLSPGVTVEPAGVLRFSTVFTPNKDGEIDMDHLPTGGQEVDQFFYPPIREKVVDYKLQVFNRLGVLIFETHDINRPWNGYYHNKLCSQGVYVWYVEGKYANGVPFKKVGDVTLLH